MTSASNHEDHGEHVLEPARRPGRRRSLAVGRTAATVTALLGVALLAAGCGGSNGPGVAGGGSNKSNRTPASTASSGGLTGQFLAYARCMRSHGVSDFPDPTTSGGVGIILPRGLNPNSPTFKAASQACRALAPAGHPATASAQKLAAEVNWAHCMRSHGVPSFPDPNGQGAFDSSKFNENTPAFQSASKACQSLMKALGPVPVVPGRSSG
jgi:hypothetical protein